MQVSGKAIQTLIIDLAQFFKEGKSNEIVLLAAMSEIVNVEYLIVRNSEDKVKIPFRVLYRLLDNNKAKI